MTSLDQRPCRPCSLVKPSYGLKDFCCSKLLIGRKKSREYLMSVFCTSAFYPGPTCTYLALWVMQQLQKHPVNHFLIVFVNFTTGNMVIVTPCTVRFNHLLVPSVRLSTVGGRPGIPCRRTVYLEQSAGQCDSTLSTISSDRKPICQALAFPDIILDW